MLGVALQQQGKLADAEAACRKAVALDPDLALGKCNLGHVLQAQGRFAEALPYLREGHEIGSKKPQDWPYPSAQWTKDCERLVEVDAKLPKVLKGEIQPTDAGERVALAHMCQNFKGLYRAASQFYADAFAEQPKLAEDLKASYRYDAACAAALAGCGNGNDAGNLDDKERVRLRRQALDWLRADLIAWAELLAKDGDKARPAAAQTLKRWQEDADFAGVRGKEALAKLPEAERVEWQKLWADVEDTLVKAREKTGAEEKAKDKADK